MKKLISLLLSLCLLGGLFAGCHGQLLPDPASTQPTVDSGAALTIPTFPTDVPVTEPTEATTPATETLPTVDPDEAPKRLQNAGMRDYLPDGYIDMIPFSEMEYVRPDSDALLDEMTELTAMVEREDDPDAILQAYYAMCNDYINFNTMDSLAYIRYTLNTNDSYYKDEYDALEQISSDVQEKLEAFNKACAHSGVREALERDYFGYGYFDEYEDYEVYTNPDYLALAKQEDELLSQYRSALEAPQVVYNGKTYDYNDFLENFEIESYNDYVEYLGVLKAYYETYNESVGSIYIELVKVRQQQAEVLGYESYGDYAYEISYERDYSYEQGLDYLEQVKTALVPVYKQYGDAEYGNDFSMSQQEVVEALRSAIDNIGGQPAEAYQFMMAYGLCDLTAATEKFDSSYTTYLYNYEAPFLTVNAHGNSDDLITFSHEFGHFTDSYVTYSSDEDLETAETFSQAMEFLALRYSEGVLSDAEVESLIRGNLSATLATFTFQSALASFEAQVYALDESELTLDRINDIYRQCCKDYGVYESFADFYYSMGWIDITHFFEVPYYVISYVVSADTALQVFRLEEQTPGAGLDAYNRLLEREAGDGVQTVMEKAGLDNPFRAGSLDELADFFREELGS